MTIKDKKQLGLFDITILPTSCVILGGLPSPFSNAKREIDITYYLFQNLLIVRTREFFNGQLDLEDQCEIPINALKWIISSIEQKFEKTPSEGGLPKQKLHIDTTIEGEQLELRYGTNVGGEGIGGYSIYNFSRLNYIDHESFQEFSIDLDTWNNEGRKFFKDIAHRFQNGLLLKLKY